jgi:hypothetical protein
MAGQSLTRNANYIVTIRKGTGNFIVQANASAKLSIQIENRWVNILEALGFSSSSSNPLGSFIANTANAAQIFSGSNFLPNIATTHVWRGSSGIELSLQLRFDAWEDAGQDVLLPVQKLIAMFAPYRKDGSLSLPGVNVNYGQWFLHPPGPTPAEYITGGASGKMITVSLGKVMVINGLIPTTLQWEFEERFTKEGAPVCALVTVGFISYALPTADELLGMFNQQLVTAQQAAVLNQ